MTAFVSVRLEISKPIKMISSLTNFGVSHPSLETYHTYFFAS